MKEEEKKNRIKTLIHSDLERKTVSEGGEVNQRTGSSAIHTHIHFKR